MNTIDKKVVYQEKCQKIRRDKKNKTKLSIKM